MTTKQTGRIPGLDGVRAVAIFLVIALHLCQRLSLGDSRSALGVMQYFAFGRGADGVGIFFVLSGFLITTLLIREHAETGGISLKGFYLRRAFRILPPLYTYLLFVIIFSAIVHLALQPGPMLASAFFYRNYAPGLQWSTEHTWSLSVEEQFYLLWPPVLVWVSNRRGRGAAATLATVLIAITPLLRVVTKLSHISIFAQKEAILLHTRMDALMCGCLVALLTGEPRFESFFRRVVARWWWLLGLEVFIFSGAMTLAFGPFWLFTVGYTVDSICVALLLIWIIRNEDSWVGKVLNCRFMVTAGVLSYSAYIWQTFFLHRDNPTRLNHLPWNIAWIWLAAWISYTVVEQPALSLRKRIQDRAKLRGIAPVEIAAHEPDPVLTTQSGYDPDPAHP